MSGHGWEPAGTNREFDQHGELAGVQRVGGDELRVLTAGDRGADLVDVAVGRLRRELLPGGGTDGQKYVGRLAEPDLEEHGVAVVQGQRLRTVEAAAEVLVSRVGRGKQGGRAGLGLEVKAGHQSQVARLAAMLGVKLRGPAAGLGKGDQHAALTGVVDQQRPLRDHLAGGRLEPHAEVHPVGRLQGELGRIAHRAHPGHGRPQPQTELEERAAQVGQPTELGRRKRLRQKLPCRLGGEMRIEELLRIEEQVGRAVLLDVGSALDVAGVPGRVNQPPAAPQPDRVPGMVHLARRVGRPIQIAVAPPIALDRDRADSGQFAHPGQRRGVAVADALAPPEGVGPIGAHRGAGEVGLAIIADVVRQPVVQDLDLPSVIGHAAGERLHQRPKESVGLAEDPLLHLGRHAADPRIDLPRAVLGQRPLRRRAGRACEQGG